MGHVPEVKYCLQCRRKLEGADLAHAYAYRVNSLMRYPFCSKGCMFTHKNSPVRKTHAKVILHHQSSERIAMDPNFKRNASENLKRQVEANPGGALVAAFAAVGALGKLVKALAEHKNARTWKKEVNRRNAKDKSKK